MEGKRIIFLPIWGKQNETIPQKQMEAIRDLGGFARYGLPVTLFPLTRSAIAFRPDLISLDWIHQYAVSPGWFASLVKSFFFAIDVVLVQLIFKPKMVWTMHNLQHHDPRPRKIERWISKFFASKCSFIRVLGPGIEAVVAEYLELPKSKIISIPEGPFVGWYPDDVAAAQARVKLKLDPADRVWLYFGNLRPYKGVEQLIGAFKNLAKPNSRLIIAGRPFDNHYAQSLKDLCLQMPDVVLDFRTIPDDEIQIFFAASDLVVLPFKNVLNSGSAILAMGFSKPVVAPAIGLLPFRLKSQPDLLYRQNEKLEDALIRSEKFDNEALAEIGRKNREEVLQYKWEDFAKFLLKIASNGE